jgi:hypothetical protein
MRRKDREIKEQNEIDAIIQNSQVCHIALAQDDQPYGLPLSFGYDGKAVYFHTALAGKKIDFWEQNPQVCLSFVGHHELIEDENSPCRWSICYESVIASGEIQELTGKTERVYGLNQIMRHYSGRDWHFSASAMTNTRLWRVRLEEVTGKRSPRKST